MWLGVGEREIVAPLNGVGSLTLMPETNHTFFEIFSVFSFESFLNIDVTLKVVSLCYSAKMLVK